MRGRGLWACALALSTATLHADDVFLKSGGRVTGRVLARSDTSVEIDVGAGRVTVPMSSVLRIEERRSTLDEYHERAERLRVGDVSGWADLAKWAAAAELTTQSRQAWQRVLDAAPGHPEANAALGRVQIDGRWVSEDEGNRARGLVKFEGRWITPAEHAAIVAQRAVAAQERQAQLEGRLRVREAEARAREAEARAYQAEVEAAAASLPVPVGIPYWWGAWGGVGPIGPPPTSSYRPRGPMSGPYWDQPLPGMIGPVGPSLPSISPFAPPGVSQRPVALPQPGARPHSDMVHGQRTRTRD
jgi:hypothetical protein